LLALSLCISTLPAAAGDRALIDFIGYSHGYRYLAIEEYGVNDGIETAFSNIYIVDLTNGDFAGGSPFRAEAGEVEQQPLTEIRAKTAAAAKASLHKLQIDTPVEIEALYGDGLIDTPATMRFGMPAVSGVEPGGADGDYTLTLDTFALPLSETCRKALDRPGNGFALSISGDGPTRELHRDKGDLPEWRGCSLGYRIYAVITPFEGGEISNAAAIVSNYPFAFEGSARRFLVVPIGANE
jgi:predicted secreted protein